MWREIECTESSWFKWSPRQGARGGWSARGPFTVIVTAISWWTARRSNDTMAAMITYSLHKRFAIR